MDWVPNWVLFLHLECKSDSADRCSARTLQDWPVPACHFGATAGELHPETLKPLVTPEYLSAAKVGDEDLKDG